MARVYMSDDNNEEQKEDTGRKDSQQQLKRGGTSKITMEEFGALFGGYEQENKYMNEKTKRDAVYYGPEYAKAVENLFVGEVQEKKCDEDAGIHRSAPPNLWKTLEHGFTCDSHGSLDETFEADKQRVHDVALIGKHMAMTNAQRAEPFAEEDEATAASVFGETARMVVDASGSPRTLRRVKGGVRRIVNSLK
ncbi:hypothetical protein LTR36_007166 [Oleoguttula mirabilis]|uniref:Uncharacterized protein n=1 Tax=Oleoguttula mirabilis TaxID=1507867 RepID=A0AAV9JAE0_9PEZI|nr:hypothetical protein LTR36_007166 [Oleoguttula mirabilis]